MADVGGRRVATLVDEERAAGSHAVSLEPGRLAAGGYFVRLEAGGRDTMTRVVYLR